jgi:hypothetical protein
MGTVYEAVITLRSAVISGPREPLSGMAHIKSSVFTTDFHKIHHAFTVSHPPRSSLPAIRVDSDTAGALARNPEEYYQRRNRRVHQPGTHGMEFPRWHRRRCGQERQPGEMGD